MSIKSLLKNNRRLLILSAYCYSLITIIKSLKYIICGKIICKGAFLRNVKFKLSGNDIKIRIGAGSVITNCRFYCKGDNISITIKGDKTYIKNTYINCEDNESTILIDKYFTMEGGHFSSSEGKKIIVGQDCMFSIDVEIRNGDSHSILNQKSHERINKARSVIIGNHVWLCAHCRVLKGSFIPDNSIIGNSTTITGKFEDENSIYAGSPAKKVKGEIIWDRFR